MEAVTMIYDGPIQCSRIYYATAREWVTIGVSFTENDSISWVHLFSSRMLGEKIPWKQLR